MSSTQVQIGKPPQRTKLTRLTGLVASSASAKTPRRTWTDRSVSTFISNYAKQIGGTVRSTTRPGA